MQHPLQPDQFFEFFLAQLDKIDDKNKMHLDKIEAKLDKLVEMTSSVATLQERSAQQNAEINDLRGAADRNKQAIDQGLVEIARKVDTEVKALKLITEHTTEKMHDVDNSAKKYIHIGTGLGIAAGMFLSVIQFFGYEYAKSVKDDYTQVKARVELISNELREIERKNDSQDIIIKNHVEAK